MPPPPAASPASAPNSGRSPLLGIGVGLLLLVLGGRALDAARCRRFPAPQGTLVAEVREAWPLTWLLPFAPPDWRRLTVDVVDTGTGHRTRAHWLESGLPVAAGPHPGFRSLFWHPDGKRFVGKTFVQREIGSDFEEFAYAVETPLRARELAIDTWATTALVAALRGQSSTRQAELRENLPPGPGFFSLDPLHDRSAESIWAPEPRGPRGTVTLASTPERLRVVLEAPDPDFQPGSAADPAGGDCAWLSFAAPADARAEVRRQLGERVFLLAGRPGHARIFISASDPASPRRRVNRSEEPNADHTPANPAALLPAARAPLSFRSGAGERWFGAEHQSLNMRATQHLEPLLNTRATLARLPAPPLEKLPVTRWTIDLPWSRLPLETLAPGTRAAALGIVIRRRAGGKTSLLQLGGGSIPGAPAREPGHLVVRE